MAASTALNLCDTIYQDLQSFSKSSNKPPELTLIIDKLSVLRSDLRNIFKQDYQVSDKEFTQLLDEVTTTNTNKNNDPNNNTNTTIENDDIKAQDDSNDNDSISNLSLSLSIAREHVNKSFKLFYTGVSEESHLIHFENDDGKDDDEKEDIKNKIHIIRCDKDHPLIKLTNADLVKRHRGYARGFVCDVCKKGKGKEDCYHCDPCGYDLCIDCYDKLQWTKQGYTNEEIEIKILEKVPLVKSYRRRKKDNRIVRVMEFNKETEKYKCSLVNPGTTDLSPIFENLLASQLSKIPILSPTVEDYILAYKISGIDDKDKRLGYESTLTDEQKQSQQKSGEKLLQAVKNHKHDDVFTMLGNGDVRGYNGLNWSHEKFNRGEAPLWKAISLASLNNVRHLLFEGFVDVNIVQEKYKHTPLMDASQGRNRDEICDMLLKCPRVDYTPRDVKGQTALFYASKWNGKATLELLFPSENGIPFINDLSEDVIKEKGYKIGLNPLDTNDEGICLINTLDVEHYGQEVSLLRCLGGDENYPPLHGCAIEGRIDLANRLLELGYDVNKENKHGKTPLYYAKLHGHEELIKLLESHGAAVGMVGTYRTIINRKSDYFDRIVRVMRTQDNTKDNEYFYCSVVNPDTKDGSPIFINNVNKSELSPKPIYQVPYLRPKFDKNSYIEREDSFSQETKDLRQKNADLLCEACIAGDATKVFNILANGNIDINWCDFIHNGKGVRENFKGIKFISGAIHLAVRSRNYECVNHLLFEDNLNINLSEGTRAREYGALTLAAFRDDLKVGGLFLQVCSDIDLNHFAYGPQTDYTPLSSAINGGKVEFAKLLLHPPNNEYIHYIPYMHEFGDEYENSDKLKINGKTVKTLNLQKQQRKIIRLGADVNQKVKQNRAECTPLGLSRKLQRSTIHWQLRADNIGKQEIEKYIIAYGGDAKIPPLHGAALENKEEIIRRYITDGWDVNKKNGDGKTAIELAVEKENIHLSSYLWISGAKVGKGTSKERMEFGEKYGIIETVSRMLIDGNEDDLAAMRSFSELGDLSMLKFMFDNKKNKKTDKQLHVDMRNSDNRTLLHIACENNRIDCVKYLLENNANMLIKDENGQHCVGYAILTGRIELVKFLCYMLTFKFDSNGGDNGGGDVETMAQFLDINRLSEEARELGFHQIVSFFHVLHSACENGNMTMIRSIISDNSSSRDKIESKCWDLIKQRHCCQLFLTHLGCKDNGDDNKNNNYDSSWHDSYSHFKFETKGVLDTFSANNVMNGIVKTIFTIIDKKLPLSDDLVMLCLSHLKNINDESTMIELLKKVIRSTLSIDNPSKKRDGLYFKRFLLESNIWFETVNNNGNNNNGGLLYDEISETVDKELEKQQTFLKESFLDREKYEGGYWRSILNYKEWIDDSDMKMNSGLRQDCIPNGIKARFSANELFTNDLTGFDGKEEYDLRIFLTELLITSQALNGQFQKDGKRVGNLIGGFYSAGPVKVASRCQVKAQTDYSDRPWPATAQIVDLVRCSYTFNDCKSMSEGLTRFEKLIKAGKGGSIKKVLRVKNMFSQYKGLHDKFATLSLNKFAYCDIKMNVLIDDNGKAIIGELQFLLKFMSTAKTMGHSLYGIVRRKEFIDDVRDMMQNIQHTNVDSNASSSSSSSSDVDKYGQDMEYMIIKKDYNRLCNEVLYHSDNLILKHDKYGKSFLCSMLQSDWKQAIKLYYSTLIYFDQRYQLNNQFITHYINQESIKKIQHKEILKSKFYRA